MIAARNTGYWDAEHVALVANVFTYKLFLKCLPSEEQQEKKKKKRRVSLLCRLYSSAPCNPFESAC